MRTAVILCQLHTTYSTSRFQLQIYPKLRRSTHDLQLYHPPSTIYLLASYPLTTHYYSLLFTLFVIRLQVYYPEVTDTIHT